MDKEDSKQKESGAQQEPARHQETYESEASGGSQQEIATTQQDQWWREWWDKWTGLERIQVIFTGLLTLFTIIYALTTVWQFMYLIGKDRLDQRAWVGVANAVKPSTLEAGVPMMLGVTITNSGKTPARQLTARAIVESARGDRGFSPKYPLREQEPQVILPPGGSMDAVDQTIMPQEEIDALKNGSRVLYFFGKVSYEDIFGRAYCYTYCSYLNRNLINLRNCPTYNNETKGRCEEQLDK